LKITGLKVVLVVLFASSSFLDALSICLSFLYFLAFCLNLSVRETVVGIFMSLTTMEGHSMDWVV
jgi:hypothetical protein